MAKTTPAYVRRYLPLVRCPQCKRTSLDTRLWCLECGLNVGRRD